MSSATAIKLDDVQREQLLLDHLPQVQYIARRIHDRLPSQVLLEDLVHTGILGLIDAVRKYDPGKNVQLKYYAEFRIRGAILDSPAADRLEPWAHFAQASAPGRAGHSDLQGPFRARSHRDRNRRGTPDQPRRTFAAAFLGDLARPRYRESAKPTRTNPATRKRSCNTVQGVDEDDPFHTVTLRSEMKGLLERAIGELPLREREVLALYHFEELTMREVGAVLGIGESRVSQIRTTAVLRLPRARLRQWFAKSNPRNESPSPRRSIALSSMTA